MTFAAWTGEIVLIHAGDLVARYDPDIDTWLEQTDLCDIRESPAVVWTGTELIEWGGGVWEEGDCNPCAWEFKHRVLRIGTDGAVRSADAGTPSATHTAYAWTDAGLWVWSGQAAGGRLGGAVYQLP